MDLFDLSGRRAFIPGGYGGIGSAIAAGLCRAGASVAVAGRPVQLALRPGALRITPRLCWYTAAVVVGTTNGDTLGLTSSEPPK